MPDVEERPLAPSHETTPSPIWSTLQNPSHSLADGPFPVHHPEGGRGGGENLQEDMEPPHTSFPTVGLHAPLEDLELSIQLSV